MATKSTQKWSSPQLFGSTHQDRRVQARQLFFNEGIRPSGLVNEAVIQSWMRCIAAHCKTEKIVTFDPVSSSRLHSVLSHSRELLEVARQQIVQMESALADTSCRVILTDAKGVVVHATQHVAVRQPRLHKAVRVGVNLAEHVLGTTAPGITVRTGQPSCVMGGEHFYDFLSVFRCAAAPIRDIHGNLAAVLDLSTDAGDFNFDAMFLVGNYATSIENKLLQSQSREHMVVHMHVDRSFLNTPLEALVGVDARGQVAWSNPAAQRLLGLATNAIPKEALPIMGMPPDNILRLTRHTMPMQHRLPNGLTVWLYVQLHARDGLPQPAVALRGDLHEKSVENPPLHALPAEVGALPLPHQARLQDHCEQWVSAALASHAGNISKTARALGVSRGKLYRQLSRKDAKARFPPGQSLN